MDIATGGSGVCFSLHTRLPPLSPEQQQAADARKAKEAEEAQRQVEALTRAQDTLAARFGKGGGISAQSSPAQIPRKAVEAPGNAGPSGGTSPSAEAHSGEAARK
ncbi:hypothetical protein [Cupriavidus sp. CuC1]|uniref:hypothetical protein n=1 Tax=Cupriavidus sp. CuC1 TaxID=3373131 RepID=UPI0037CFD77A